MKTLVDFSTDGRRYVAVSGLENSDGAAVFQDTNGYELLRALVDASGDWSAVLQGARARRSPAVRFDHREPAYHPPGTPSDVRNCVVSAFGNTHLTINGATASQKDIDWYYKGNASDLVTTKQTLTSGIHAYGCGIEIELAAVFMINSLGDPVYLGHTVANDFSDVEMRHRMPGLGGLSKLAQTALGHALRLEALPTEVEITCTIERGGEPVWRSIGRLGSDVMKCKPADLAELLFQSPAAKGAAYTIHYVLLGAAVSSQKANFELQHLDRITVRDRNDDLVLQNSFADEAVIYSCC